jgi:hypothetical protein
MGYCPIARAQKFGEGIVSILAQSTLRTDNSAYVQPSDTQHMPPVGAQSHHFPMELHARCDRPLLPLLLLLVLAALPADTSRRNCPYTGSEVHMA